MYTDSKTLTQIHPQLWMQVDMVHSLGPPSPHFEDGPQAKPYILHGTRTIQQQSLKLLQNHTHYELNVTYGNRTWVGRITLHPKTTWPRPN